MTGMWYLRRLTQEVYTSPPYIYNTQHRVYKDQLRRDHPKKDSFNAYANEASSA